MQSKSLVPSILDLFKDVDKLEEDIIHMFDELSDFLNEISSHYKALSNFRAKCTN